ncbi:reverse transcriptase domain-containing protein [Tanacetum coccineum]
MVTPVKKRSSNKFCDFHNDKGYNTDECMQLKKQIEELVRAGKLSHLIKETKQGRDQTNVKKKETPAKYNEITFPPLTTSKGTEGPLVVEEDFTRHMIHRMPGIREIQAVPSMAYGMLKFLVDGGIVTIRSTILIPTECATDQEVAIGGTLCTKERTELCSLLKKNLDIFAWQPSDMTGVPQSIAEHRLNIREGYSPVRQKKRGQAPERVKSIQAEVHKLVEVGIMREVYYHDWLSNPVMVKKHDESWRICVDFTDLNKACPQDCYLLPEIDWKVESFCGYPFKCFLNAYKGYHQIQMEESDEEKTAFHTSQGVYCYTKMPFSLKNDGATYQRLVDKAFNNQVGWNIEVYVDELVIKSYTKTEMLRDIDETFHTFLSKSAEKSLSLFKTLKKCIKKSDFHWTPKAEQAFKQLKQHLSKLPLLTSVYFISRALQGPELNYTPMEKLVLALVFAAKRLRRYFQAHPIAVITDQPIKQIISRPDMAGRLQKWSVMLGEHSITYRPSTSVKGQILADFLVEKPDEAPQDTLVIEIPQEPLTLFTDGSSCVDGSGAGLILTSPEGTEFTYALRFQFTTSNNEAEYEALIAGLRTAAQMGVRNVHSNGLIERANRSLGEGIKARLGEGNKNWIEELPHVLWAHRTMIKSSHGDTPFSLTYGTEAVIPVEIGMPTYRTTVVEAVQNNEELRLNLDLLEERRERATIREAKAKFKMTKYYHARVRGVTFRLGDFVYHSNEASHAMDGGKLGPKWEGPYEVTKALRDGAYRLRSIDRTVLSRTWNIANLKKCYL